MKKVITLALTGVLCMPYAYGAEGTAQASRPSDIIDTLRMRMSGALPVLRANTQNNVCTLGPTSYVRNEYEERMARRERTARILRFSSALVTTAGLACAAWGIISARRLRHHVPRSFLTGAAGLLFVAQVLKTNSYKDKHTPGTFLADAGSSLLYFARTMLMQEAIRTYVNRLAPLY